MKKVMLKGKKILAIVVLTLMVACVVSPFVEAAESVVGNRQYNSSKGYRSHTKISGFYDDRGYAYNVSAYAKIGNQDRVVYGSASATSNSKYILNKMNAYHGYAIGNTVMKVWIKN